MSNGNVEVNNSVYAKRGVFKAFRGYLNTKYSTETVGKSRQGDRNQYGNRTREYGDWLYFQDREMFDELLHRTLIGSTEQEFDGPNKWFVDTKWKR